MTAPDAIKRRWWGERSTPVKTPVPAPVVIPVVPPQAPPTAPAKRERRFPRRTGDPRHPGRWPADRPVLPPVQIGRPEVVKLIEQIEGEDLDSWGLP